MNLVVNRAPSSNDYLGRIFVPYLFYWSSNCSDILGVISRDDTETPRATGRVVLLFRPAVILETKVSFWVVDPPREWWSPRVRDISFEDMFRVDRRTNDGTVRWERG